MLMDWRVICVENSSRVTEEGNGQGEGIYA